MPQTPYVIVVDDEKIIAETLAMIFRGFGFSAASFTNPLEALESGITKAPDLMISDVMMPQLSGIELAIRMRQQCPKCRILLFSGQAATGDLLADARKQGHDFSLLAKPLHPKDLLRRIREHNATWIKEGLPPIPEFANVP